MEKDEVLDRIFSVASFYQDSIDRLVNNGEIDKEEEIKMRKDLEALQTVLNYFDMHYDERTFFPEY